MSSQQSKVVGLIFGGASGEHDVSIRSAATVAEGLASGANKERYRVQHVYIDRQGRWWGDAIARQVLSSGQALADDGSRPGFSGFPDGCLEVEIWYPVLHGPNGEDGTIQGLFSLMQRPFVGSGVLGSAVGMDKLAMKAAFSAAGLPQGPYRPVLASELGSNSQLLEELETQLGYPCFIKPANLGSSVGISKATNRSELQAGLDLAASHDSRLLVEKGLQVRELECAVLGGQHLKASVLGEVSFDADWYDYETKYSSGLSSTQIPADLPEAISSRAQLLAIEAVQAVGASGLSRVDFFYEEASGSLLINEINTLPGFTSQSMYPMLWNASGVPLEELVHQLLELAQ
ncbi:D-alanine--D-alanine ligase family protein [Synechococcus sp. Minos11]|uniref:D-alanine--D-alanine ligase family protein n=1 Tax=Synechococcus sp. Minos11 TaxID=221341 RepID=UPI0016493CA9|nr:D-alanine--D-alanine ligase family protein [Synechococcus sp. Minos11]QNJ08151.1 D-alanine--D-alanine ligase family protein [Synechococcus sp. Minos11]